MDGGTSAEVDALDAGSVQPVRGIRRQLLAGRHESVHAVQAGHGLSVGARRRVPVRRAGHLEER